MKLTKSVAIIGLGYVGLPLALLAAQKGWRVFGIDIDSQKISGLKNTKMILSSDFNNITAVSVIIICVPTPVYKNRTPDYRSVRSASHMVGKFLKPGQLVILESTVNPGVCEELMIPELESASGLIAGRDFFVAHCPERINPGDQKWNVRNIPRVIGGLDRTSLDLALYFYRSVLSAPLTEMASLKEAEAVKIVENSFRNINIAFVNELAKSFSCMDIDLVNVIRGCSTKPFSFLAHYPGCGVGGHCISVDPYYLINYTRKKYGFSHNLLALACKTNESMPEFTIELVKIGLKKIGLRLPGTRVAVLGVAYKPNIEDCRESPAFPIINRLKKQGAKVTVFDPYVKGHSTVSDLKSALTGSVVVVLVTAHDQFKKLTPQILKSAGVKLVVDGRNIFDPFSFKQSGISYTGIGRS